MKTRHSLVDDPNERRLVVRLRASAGAVLVAALLIAALSAARGGAADAPTTIPAPSIESGGPDQMPIGAQPNSEIDPVNWMDQQAAFG